MNRGWLASWVLVMVLALVSPAWIQADEAHPGGESDASQKHEEQSDFFKGLVDLSIWTIVVFLLLLFVLGKFAWPLMQEGLDKRERAVAAALEKALHVQAEAERIKNELEQSQRQFNEEVRRMREAERIKVQQWAEKFKSDTQAEMNLEHERLKRDLETQADQALQEMMRKVGQVALQISSKVIRRQLSEEDHNRLVDEALSELQQAAQERQRVLAGLA